MIEKDNKKYVKYSLILVFVSILLFSTGALVHNVFADTVTTTILFGNQLPYGIGINPTTNKIYVSSPDGAFTSSCCQPNNKIFVIDGSTDNILGNVTVGYESLYVGVNPTTNKIYVPGLDNSCISCNLGSSVFVINGATDTVVNKISASGNLVGVGVNPTTDKIYVGDSKGHNVYEIDGDTDTVINTIPVGGEPRGIAVNPDTNKIYVVLSTVNEIAIIDGSTNNVTGIIPVGDVPTNVAINPSTNKIYITNYGSSSCSDVYCPDPSSIGHTVSVIDGLTNDVTNTIQVGGGPYDITINPSTNKAYVTNHFDSTVSVVDTNTNTVVNTVPVGSRPEGVDTNPITDKIYVANHGRCCPPNPISVTVINESTSTTTSVPTNLSATVVSSSKINLSWITPSNNGGSQITGYHIERSSDNGTSWSTVVSNTASNATDYSDTGLAHSTMYSYRVSAINSVGTSSPSNVSSSTTFNISPSSPTSLTATGKITHIDLTWIAPGDNGGTSILGYVIQRSTDNGTTWSTIVQNTNSVGTTYTDSHLVPVKTYSYQVSAINSVGTSDSSNAVSIKPLSIPHLVSVSKTDKIHSK